MNSKYLAQENTKFMAKKTIMRFRTDFLAVMAITMGVTALSGCSHDLRGDLNEGLKPRLVVMTDIGPADVEPDDNESAVRLMSFADKYEIEGIITTVGWNCDPYPQDWAEYLDRVIDGYETDVLNLMKRSEQTGFLSEEEEQGCQVLGYWPSAGYLRSRAVMGSTRAGIGAIGEGNDSAGSELIIRLADEDDDRPIYLCAWGSANTFAQAVWRVKQERTPEELREFLHKFRLYTITDQDMHYSMRMNRAYSAHQWLRREFPEDLMLVWDESAWLNQNELGKNSWELYQKHIQNRGEMGKVYPNFLWGVEGDTPSFLNCMPNGLNDPDDPVQVGWGGCHQFGISPDGETSCWTNWEQPLKDISNFYENKFYPDEFNDFAARMEWAATGAGNHNPVVVVNGIKGLAPIRLNVLSGRSIKFDASESFDPDGDELHYQWWFQEFPDVVEYPELSSDSSPKISVMIPASLRGRTFHLICELHDDGPYNLVAYRRIIIDTI